MSRIASAEGERHMNPTQPRFWMLGRSKGVSSVVRRSAGSVVSDIPGENTCVESGTSQLVNNVPTYVLAHVQRLEQRIQMAAVLDEAVAPRPRQPLLLRRARFRVRLHQLVHLLRRQWIDVVLEVLG